MAHKRKTFIQLEFSEESAADLLGKQSVRTTFKLSERAIEALSILARQLGIKQKSLFDSLAEDTQALQMIAEGFEEFGHRKSRVSKTYVISRRTLDNLERVSMQYNTPRDALVEYSIERILPLLAREKEKHHRRKIINEQIKNYLEGGMALLSEAEANLGEDDPVFQEILTMMRSVQNCSQSVDLCLLKGEKIEKF